jgi:hypothetical protein
MGLWASDFYARIHLRRDLKILTIAACAALNTAIFVSAPVYCSYGQVRRFETELQNVVREVREVAPRQNTIIVGFDSHFLGYRHAGYYLPEYRTVQFPPVRLTSGKRIFAMEDRNTRLETALDTTSVRNFILFPLPEGDSEYSEYMVRLRKRFPPGELRTIVRGGRELVTGPAEDLRFLFPLPAAASVGSGL